jgi:hypothetical protein
VCTENLSSGVVVVKSAKDGVWFDASDSLNLASDRRIFVQGSWSPSSSPNFRNPNTRPAAHFLISGAASRAAVLTSRRDPTCRRRKRRAWPDLTIAEPDLTLEAIVQRLLAGLGLKTSEAAIRRFFKATRDHLPKKRCTRPNRIGPTCSWLANAGRLVRQALTPQSWCSSTRPAFYIDDINVLLAQRLFST